MTPKEATARIPAAINPQRRTGQVSHPVAEGLTVGCRSSEAGSARATISRHSPQRARCSTSVARSDLESERSAKAVSRSASGWSTTGAPAFRRSLTIWGTLSISASSYQLLASSFSAHFSGIRCVNFRLRGPWLLLSSLRTGEVAILASDYGEYPPGGHVRQLQGLLRLGGVTYLPGPKMP